MRGSPFFEGVTQMQATLGDEPSSCRSSTTTAPPRAPSSRRGSGRLRQLMPDPRFCPARLAPGLGAVAVTCFEYRDTDIGPYNELAISVVLNEPWFLPNVPGRALLASLRRRQLHAWVHHLPVTTEIARAGGVDLYNYPKFIGGIDFEQTATRRICRLSEGEEHILTLSGERLATPRCERFQLFSHLWMDRQPQRSEFKIDATGWACASARRRAAGARRAPPDRPRAGGLLLATPDPVPVHGPLRGDPLRARAPHVAADRSPRRGRRPRAGRLA